MLRDAIRAYVQGIQAMTVYVLAKSESGIDSRLRGGDWSTLPSPVSRYMIDPRIIACILSCALWPRGDVKDFEVVGADEVV